MSAGSSPVGRPRGATLRPVFESSYINKQNMYIILCIYIYIYVLHIYIYIYIYTYTHTHTIDLDKFGPACTSVLSHIYIKSLLNKAKYGYTSLY